ncbi:MAG: hemolysin family protein [Desulfohalobiaceae bacterium]
METLIITVLFAVGISAFCSLTEAVLYSVPWSHIESLRKQGTATGQLLYKLRSRVDEPITAILTLNTVANTAGAAVAGAAAAAVFGDDSMLWFSLVFTLMILFFSEIIPKTFGVLHNRILSVILARPLNFLVLLLWPVIKAISLVVRLLSKNKMGPQSTEEDLRALASLTRKTGVLKRFEELSIHNILNLDTKTVEQVMTPRTVIFSLPAESTVAEVWNSKNLWPHSRVPVYSSEDQEDIVGIVYRREVLQALAQDEDEKKLKELMKPVHFILESLTLDRVLVTFLESRLHLAVVLDEYGGLTGLISLEDILEEILGNEIMDETDQVADMRELALQRKMKKMAWQESSE